METQNKHYNLTPYLLELSQHKPKAPGRYSVSELYGCLNGWKSPEQFLDGEKTDIVGAFRMWSGRFKHEGIQEILRHIGWECEVKKEYVFEDFTIVGKVDAVKDNEILEIKTSEEVLAKAKDWHVFQARMYCSMFEKEYAKICQPIIAEQQLILRVLRTCKRDDGWFSEQLLLVKQFHELCKSLQRGREK